jgi:hypothetical protein
VLRGCPGLAAIALCLLPAPPAAARESEDKRGEPQNPALSALVRADAAGARKLLPDSGRRGLRYSANDIIRTDGSPGREARIVGSLPVGEAIDLGLGLYSVTGAEPKERQLRRVEPLRDVAPRTSRVAAVGLRMRF